MPMLNLRLRQQIQDALTSEINDVRLVAKDEFTLTYEISLADAREVWLRIPTFGGYAPIIHSEVATLRYIGRHTSIPVPSVLAVNHGQEAEQTGSESMCYMLLQKPPGVCVESKFSTMTPSEQNLIVAAIARWMVELFQCRFDAIGSLHPYLTDDHRIGPVTMKPFYADGRSKFSLDRGPFKSAKAYYQACAQRELDSSRMLFVQGAPPSYQHELAESRLMVERIAGLLCDLTNRCEGLDEGDPELAPFSLDIHEMNLKNIYVSSENPTTILSVVNWQYINTRPLWCCARLPPWLEPSLSAENEQNKRLAAIFRAEVSRIAGVDSLFLRALGLEDARSTLDDLSTYDAFRDGFLLLPALENILAALPGHEDVAGLTALLDPTTLPGRVARINLLTRGSNAMYLAMTPPRSPLMGSVDEGTPDKANPAESPVLVL